MEPNREAGVIQAESTRGEAAFATFAPEPVFFVG
jgi:hypothetical protein